MQSPANTDTAAILHSVRRLLRSRGADLLGHSLRTGRLAHRFGQHLNLAPSQLSHLHAAADLHDIGKLDIPDRILLKPGRLDADEWQQMQAHSAMGEHRLVAMGMHPDDPIVSAVRHHHESFDGTGYPDRLDGHAIPLFARIISIADSYDAIASARAYHDARSHAEIVDIMLHQSHHYDPGLLNQFAHMMDFNAVTAVPHAESPKA